MTELEKFIIDKVIKLRRKRGLIQSDLANVLSVSPSFIGNIENPRNPSKYNIKHVSLLAEYFDLPPIYFFIDDEEYVKIMSTGILNETSVQAK